MSNALATLVSQAATAQANAANPAPKKAPAKKATAPKKPAAPKAVKPKAEAKPKAAAKPKAEAKPKVVKPVKAATETIKTVHTLSYMDGGKAVETQYTRFSKAVRDLRVLTGKGLVCTLQKAKQTVETVIVA